MRSPMLGEFMGTLVMILLGDGVVAGVLLKRSKAENSGWLVITTAWAFAVLCGIFTALLFGSSDAHLNPAITLAAAIQRHDFSKLLPYAAAQIAGAFCGAVLVWLFYLSHWSITEDADAKRGVFCTSPAIRNYPANLFSECVATFVLVLVIGAMSSKLVLSSGAPAGFGPYLVSCLIWGIGLSLGGTTGYALNPARDLGPRIAHAVLPIAGKSHSDWAYAWVPILGPAIGASAAGFVLYLIGA
ncbi:glycerol uptake facilitator protein [Silvibacterium bohemicum]|uniref:Glycerol uptake facilitator protein n=1 Tax=Silvibacterium bohemicum TaxID=1577686 RepID=A0A841JUJ0_9BACT|nr:MIP/aquaporin family protein [Silvibacterium bohemicum]MBB6143419.1 glycerol uptake facilitator protein [Silvibacterium bohemicum]